MLALTFSIRSKNSIKSKERETEKQAEETVKIDKIAQKKKYFNL